MRCGGACEFLLQGTIGLSLPVVARWGSINSMLHSLEMKLPLSFLYPTQSFQATQLKLSVNGADVIGIVTA